MTYCVAITLASGAVFAADSRTNAGVDYVSTYRKVHTFETEGDRTLVLLSAGNLATTQAVVNHVRRDLDRGGRRGSLARTRYLFEAAEYLGDLSYRIQQRHAGALREAGAKADASFILGGQIGAEPHGAYLIYPQGNFIAATPDTPFLQIGESKYGKPILDRIIHPDLPLADAARCALVSVDSTMRSNISVGPPVDVAIYERDSLRAPHRQSFDADDAYFTALRDAWNDGLKRAFTDLPRFDWERAGEERGTASGESSS